MLFHSRTSIAIVRPPGPNRNMNSWIDNSRQKLSVLPLCCCDIVSIGTARRPADTCQQIQNARRPSFRAVSMFLARQDAISSTSPPASSQDTHQRSKPAPQAFFNKVACTLEKVQMNNMMACARARGPANLLRQTVQPDAAAAQRPRVCTR